MAFNPGGGGGTLSASPDVALSSPVNGQPLVYNQSIAKWNNSAVPVAQVAGLANVAKTGNYTDVTGRPTIPTTASQVGAVPLGGGTGKVWLGGATQPAGMAIGDYWVHDA